MALASAMALMRWGIFGILHGEPPAPAPRSPPPIRAKCTTDADGHVPWQRNRSKNVGDGASCAGPSMSLTGTSTRGDRKKSAIKPGRATADDRRGQKGHKWPTYHRSSGA